MPKSNSTKRRYQNPKNYKKFFALNEDSGILVDHLQFEDNTPAVQIRHWCPLSFVSKSAARKHNHKLIPTKRGIVLTTFDAIDLKDVLSKILPPKSEVKHPDRLFSKFTYPHRSIVTLPNGTKFETKDEERGQV